LSRMSQRKPVSSLASTTCLVPLTVKSILLTTTTATPTSIQDTNAGERVQISL
jgi:hypothetical protein